MRLGPIVGSLLRLIECGFLHARDFQCAMRTQFGTFRLSASLRHGRLPGAFSYLCVGKEISRRALKILPLAGLCLFSSFHAHAKIDPPPVVSLIDQNGVNIALARYSTEGPEIGVGQKGQGGLFFRPSFQTLIPNGTADGSGQVAGWRNNNLFGAIESNPENGEISAFWGEHNHVFSDAYSIIKDGSSLAPLNGGWAPGGGFLYTAVDGTKIYFESSYFPGCASEGYTTDSHRTISKVERPDGEVITWHWAVKPGPCLARRIQSVTNNIGHHIHYKYKSDTNDNNWNILERVTAIDGSFYNCSPTSFTCDVNGGGQAWPYLDFSTDAGALTRTITDRLGRASAYGFSQVYNNERQLTYVRRPENAGVNYTSISVSITNSGGFFPGSGQYAVGTLSLTSAGVPWTYTFSQQGAQGKVVVTNPSGYSREIIYEHMFGSGTSGSVVVKDKLNGSEWQYQHYPYNADSPYALLRVTDPLGSYKEYLYQIRRLVSRARYVASPSSGLSDVYLYAAYPEPAVAVCSNAKTCNKPLWVTVPGGASGNPSALPKTDFTYDVNHGGVLTVTAPAAGSGPYASIRPETRYTYSNNGTPITRVQTEKSCATAASCAGQAQETVVEYVYNSKRRPTTVTSRAGNVSSGANFAQTVTAYTPQGDVASVDGPLTGTADTRRMYYDAARQLRAVVEPDRDGAGALTYPVMRMTYNGDGNPTIIERGQIGDPANCASPNFCSAMSVLERTTFAYDTFSRKVRENQINVSTSQFEAVTQFSYDTIGRVECAVRRMNPAQFGSLPGACTLGAVGGFGQDRITRTTYTVNNDVATIQTGYGTSLQRTERAYTYLLPGLVQTVKDAKNNLTTYEYDGFNRLKKTRYPVPTVGANLSSDTDYEEWGYNASSLVVSERRRDGQVIAKTYDNLQRLRTVDRPGTEPTITHSYDSHDRIVSSADGALTLTYAYDALHRMLSEAQPVGTVNYQYDAANRRTRLTYPGSGLYVEYEYHAGGDLWKIKENGAASGVGLLATYVYDALGRRVSMARGNGAATSYAYDALSRLSTFAHDMTTGGATYDQSWSFAYTPANQIASRSLGKSFYEWPGTAPLSHSYAVNGLNQYTSVGGQSISHDLRGNTTNDGTKSYTYDSSNRLVSSTNGAAAVFDPTGRLYQVSQAGATTRFLYDGPSMIAEYNGSNVLQRRHVHGAGVDEPIMWYNGTGTTNRRHVFGDERGSIIAEDNGSAVNTKRYDEYGNADGPYVGRFQYTGQMWLGEFGLNHYKARAYNPRLGRFMQTDPIGYEDQANLYAYVRNDPINAFDPSGKYCNFINRGGAFCLRSQRMADLDRDPQIRDKTTFAAAASLILEELGALDESYSASYFTSRSTREFLGAMSAALEKSNMAMFDAIRRGEGFSQASVAENDRAFVRYEQGLVQGYLDGLKATNIRAYNSLVKESNNTLNSAFGHSRQYNQILSSAREALGVSRLDFSDMTHRVAIGDAATAAVRADQNNTCTGSSIERSGCQ